MEDTTIDAVWCWDSETGEKVLLDRRTGQVIMTERYLNGDGTKEPYAI